MGCKNSKEPSCSFLQGLEGLKWHIENDNMNVIKSELESIKLVIDDELIAIEGICFNPLAYALYLGKYKAFRYIHEIFNARVDLMESMLMRQGVCPLSLSITNGNLDLFIYYFQLQSSKALQNDKQDSMASADCLACEAKIPFIQQAVLSGFINIVSYLNQNFSESAHGPGFYDVHFVDLNTGENSALVACRSGKFVMVKLLFNLGVDFHLKNKKMQNAIQILAESDKGDGGDIYECLHLLVFEANVNFRYCYEDCLIKFNDVKAVFLLEKQLEKQGIYVTKKGVEEIYSGKIRAGKEVKVQESAELSFISYTSQASILGTLNRNDNV